MLKILSKSTVCVISLTYNRPEYIKRSFDSLYLRAGMPFEHFVFDDYSDEKTLKELKKLQKKYKFKLFTSSKRMDVYQNFHRYLSKIPLSFDYYLKLDSDIEILSDKLLVNLLEVFKFKDSVGVTPRVEGVLNADRYGGNISFFNGHAIKINSPVLFGCCLMLAKKAFVNYLKHANNNNDKWGIDAEIYEHTQKDGIFITVEDVSVYHIDNTYGQRRINSNYFLNRKRWQNIDTNETSFLLASKYIYPKYIKTVIYKKLIQETLSLKSFLKKCKLFSKQQNMAKILNIQIENNKKIDLNSKCQVFKIISPTNFPPDKNIEHGAYRYCKIVPNWAKNNPHLCVELVEVTIKEYNQYLIFYND